MQAQPSIAVLVETTTIFGREILAGVADFIRERPGWATFIRTGSEASITAALQRWRGDGLLCTLHDGDFAQRVAALDLPAVNVSGSLSPSPVPQVRGDDDHVGRLAAEHLLDQGVRRFGYCGWDGLFYSAARRRGFRRTLEAAACECDVLAYDRDPQRMSWHEQLDVLGEWLTRLTRAAGDQTVGVFTHDDCHALSVIEACRVAGLDVPERVAVLGVNDDVELCELCQPPLSSVDHGARRRGYEGAKLLASLLAGEHPPREAVLVPPTGVVARESTRVLATGDDDVSAAVRFIRDHADEPIDVEAVVEAVGVSRRGLERKFQERLGRTIHDEIWRTHVTRAQELLTRTTLSTLGVAERSGFRSASSLSTVFKRHKGMSPREYRRKYQKP